MEVPVYLYDAFTDRLFGGNVAGVVLDASGLSDRQMQAIAVELGAPTTGFVVGSEQGHPPVFEVRYFTPRQEIDLCGHVTVALFAALVVEGRCAAGADGGEASLRAAAGETGVLVYGDGGAGVAVEMGQSLPVHDESPLGSEEIQGLLGGVALRSSPPVEVASTGLRHLVVPYERPEDLGRLRPDFTALAALGREAGFDTVCAFALSNGRSRRVRMRDFCSPIGADEEPASGTTSGALASYLFRHGLLLPGRSDAAILGVEMGAEMGRPSLIEVRLKVAGGEVRGVSVLGRAVRSLKGRLSYGVEGPACWPTSSKDRWVSASSWSRSLAGAGGAPSAPSPGRSPTATSSPTPRDGLFGAAYMAAIKPFRYLNVYPALMRQIGRVWHERHRMDAGGLDRGRPRGALAHALADPPAREGPAVGQNPPGGAPRQPRRRSERMVARALPNAVIALTCSGGRGFGTDFVRPGTELSSAIEKG